MAFEGGSEGEAIGIDDVDDVLERTCDGVDSLERTDEL